MTTPAFVRFYPNDWFTGCASLKADERGVYISMCVHIWTTGQRIPLDDAEAARRLAMNFKSYQRVRDRLVVLGKITKHENGYGNERAEHEFSAASEAAGTAASRRTDATPDRSNGAGEKAASTASAPPAPPAQADSEVLTDGTIDHGIDHRIDGTIDRQKHQQNQCPSIEPLKELTTVVVDAQARTKILPVGYLEKLKAAAGDALDDPMRAFGIEDPSIPIMWLNEGCDFELDILPAVRKVAMARKGKNRVNTWNYFTQAVANAKAERERGLPPPTSIEVMPRRTSQHPYYAEKEAKSRAWREAIAQA